MQRVVAQLAWRQNFALLERLGDEKAASWYPMTMHKTDALNLLRQHREELSKLGVAHLSLYGSVARDQADEQSDVDVIVDTPDGQAPGLFLLARITDELERILGRPVDVISRRGLDHTKALKRRVAIDLVDVF